MSQFYNDMAASVLRADYTLFLILAYLTIFRLEELTFPEYRRIVESQEPNKMSSFLSFVFDVPRLSNSVRARTPLPPSLFVPLGPSVPQGRARGCSL